MAEKLSFKIVRFELVNERCQNNLACEVANLYGSQIKGFYSSSWQQIRLIFPLYNTIQYVISLLPSLQRKME